VFNSQRFQFYSAVCPAKATTEISKSLFGDTGSERPDALDERAEQKRRVSAPPWPMT
jgi:hypothetical protein